MKSLQEAQIITAMVTPFNNNDEIEHQQLKNLLEHLLKNGTQGILINGTTGEGPNLSNAEKLTMIEQTVKIIDDRVPIIAGAGSNSTAGTVAYVNELANVRGLSAILVVVPYYNKPNQAGMIAHFTKVADASSLPVIIYNIPGRTGVTMEVNTVLKLAAHPNIIGIKNCTGASDLAQLIENAPADFLVYSGEDEDALAVKTLGGAGVISVASHLFGNEISQMYRDVDQGDISAAGKIMRKLTPKIQALFSLPSPAPVKAGLNNAGVFVGAPRLPILPLTDGQQHDLMKILKSN